MRAAILSIGDELTLGQALDTNSAWLSARLAEQGVTAGLHMTVADDQAAIVRALRYAVEQAELLIVTGGLGPTDDDLTRQAVAEFLGCDLQVNAAALRQIEAFFRKIGRPMVEKNKVQAWCPVLAEPLENPAGTAPGVRAMHGEVSLFCVPGVPSEMHAMYDMHIVPFLERHIAGTPHYILTAKLNAFGAGESVIAEMLGDLMDRKRNPLVGTTVSRSIISVRIRSESAKLAAAQDAMDETIAEVRRKLGVYVFGTEDQTLADAVGALLREKNRSVVTAESCTGGLLGKMLTDAPGSSSYYLGGWVVYSNESKQRELGVPWDLIAKHGAVSEAVAMSLAEKSREKAESDYAMAVTGIAGPTGGTPEKPVGTVWVAMAERDQPVCARQFMFPGDRPDVRDRAAKTALNMLRLRLLD